MKSDESNEHMKAEMAKTHELQKEIRSKSVNSLDETFEEKKIPFTGPIDFARLHKYCKWSCSLFSRPDNLCFVPYNTVYQVTGLNQKIPKRLCQIKI